MNAKPRPVRAEERRYFKEVRFRQIRALFEISRHGSFAAAARALGMATPSVWRQVRALEDDYGVRFVAAKGRSVRLTEEGERLMRRPGCLCAECSWWMQNQRVTTEPARCDSSAAAKIS